jgi:hypothetical protein
LLAASARAAFLMFSFFSKTIELFKHIGAPFHDDAASLQPSQNLR